MTGDSGQNRLRWLCRRGMLELDTWLARFLDQGYAHLPPSLQAAFTRLLDEDDLVLFDWLTGSRAPPAEFSDLVAAIQSTRHRTP